MLPPRRTFTPLAFKSSEIIVVVVVLPSEPVTAIILQGHRSKKTSISEVSTAPFSLKATSSGLKNGVPGLRKIISPSSLER